MLRRNTSCMFKYRTSQDQTVISGLIKTQQEQFGRNRQIIKHFIDVTLSQNKVWCLEVIENIVAKV